MDVPRYLRLRKAELESVYQRVLGVCEAGKPTASARETGSPILAPALARIMTVSIAPALAARCSGVDSASLRASR